MQKKQYTQVETEEISKNIGIQWNIALCSTQEITTDLKIEVKHGVLSTKTNITNNDLAITSQIYWSNLLGTSKRNTRLLCTFEKNRTRRRN